MDKDTQATRTQDVLRPRLQRLKSTEKVDVVDQSNCTIRLGDMMAFPPSSGVSDRGWNILHFNSTNRPYHKNDSAREFVEDVLLTSKHPATTLYSDAATIRFATDLARELNPQLREGAGERIFMELGFCTGRSLNLIAALGYDREVYGFDSLAGLPEYWRPNFEEGTFRMKVNERMEKVDSFDYRSTKPFIPFVPLANTTLILGLLEDTLRIFTEDVLADNGQLELLHIDTDIYAPASFAFQVLEQFIIPGRTVIVLDEGYNYFKTEDTLTHDEWKNHEWKAARELADAISRRKGAKHRVRYHAYNHNHQQLVLTIEAA